MIQKDLNRLDREHHTQHHSRLNWRSHNLNQPALLSTFEESVQQRNRRVSRLLHLYSKNHSYHQGMHEVASYLLFVLEMDLFDLETSTVHDDYRELLDDDYLLHDAYHMLTALLHQLGQAYGLSSSSSFQDFAAETTNTVEDMGDCILAKLPYVTRDKDLYTQLKSFHLPPELFSTRWMRLMFSREVEGWRNVMCLWDVFMDYVSVVPIFSSESSRLLGGWKLMDVLEMTAACHIWMHRQALFRAQNAHDVLNILINTPPLPDVNQLLEILTQSMKRFQLHSSNNIGPLLPPSSQPPTSSLALPAPPHHKRNSTGRLAAFMTRKPAGELHDYSHFASHPPGLYRRSSSNTDKLAALMMKLKSTQEVKHELDDEKEWLEEEQRQGPLPPRSTTTTLQGGNRPSTPTNLLTRGGTPSVLRLMDKGTSFSSLMSVE